MLCKTLLCLCDYDHSSGFQINTINKNFYNCSFCAKSVTVITDSSDYREQTNTSENVCIEVRNAEPTKSINLKYNKTKT